MQTSILNLLILSVAGRAIENSYIVKLKGTARLSMQTHLEEVKALFTARDAENEVHTVYSALGNMYNAKFSKELVAQVTKMPEVEYVSKDQLFSVNTIQEYAPWGLSRISQNHRLTLEPGSQSYNYTFTGEGATVYILDTGIEVDHYEFEGRARFGARFAGDNDLDEYGHGTHCAGIVASRTFGVAKKASLVAVRVLDKRGSGSTSELISGLDWVVRDTNGATGSIINMSVGGYEDQGLTDAIEATVSSGIVVVVAAGNESNDACLGSPASAPSAITVGATDITDARASFSSYGRCVDVFAPGDEITSTWKHGQLYTNSGTSMAAPHVAGLAAYFYSEKQESSDIIAKKIITHAFKDQLSNVGPGSPNLFINNHV